MLIHKRPSSFVQLLEAGKKITSALLKGKSREENIMT